MKGPAIFRSHPCDFSKDRWTLRRFELTMIFLRKHIDRGSKILDLGTRNGLSEVMESHGYIVMNTQGEDLDLRKNLLDYYSVDADCCTAFEILEHLVNPFELLKMLPASKLVASVPLRLWFAKAYNENLYDRHYHEFEPWQFDWLLQKAGWKIIDRELHTSPTYKIGLRSILRWVSPRWYFIYAERI